MRRRPILEVLVGPIASGKTTYAQARADQGAILVSMDDITMMLHGGDYRRYDVGLKGLYRQIETDAIGHGLELGRDVVVDRTNLDLERRSRYVGLARAAGAITWAVTFPIESPETQARRRVQVDSRGYDYDVWLAVAEKHAREYVAPSVDEGFSLVLPVFVAAEVMEIDSVERDFQTVLDFSRGEHE